MYQNYQYGSGQAAIGNNSYAVYGAVHRMGLWTANKPFETRFNVTFNEGVTQTYVKKDNSTLGYKAQGEPETEQPCDTCGSPLVIDLEKDGIHLGPLAIPLNSIFWVTAFNLFTG